MARETKAKKTADAVKNLVVSYSLFTRALRGDNDDEYKFTRRMVIEDLEKLNKLGIRLDMLDQKEVI